LFAGRGDHAHGNDAILITRPGLLKKKLICGMNTPFIGFSGLTLKKGVFSDVYIQSKEQ
jgi:hypothetical protein